MEFNAEAFFAFARASDTCASDIFNLVNGLRADIEDALKDFDDQRLQMEWGRDVQHEAERLIQHVRDSRNVLNEMPILRDLLYWTEEASLDYPRPVRFREYDFMTATEAIDTIAECLVDDCSEVESWDEFPDLTDEDRVDDLRKLQVRWQAVSDDWIRDLMMQVQIETRRAIRLYFREFSEGEDDAERRKEHAGETRKGERTPRRLTATPEREAAVRRIVTRYPTATQRKIQSELADAGGAGMKREILTQLLDKLREEGVYKVPANRRKNSRKSHNSPGE